MRLHRVFIDGFKNLRNVEIDFEPNRLTTVVIGQNGSGKSNLIEAITDVFRYVDLKRGIPTFDYEVEYGIGDHLVSLASRRGKREIKVDGNKISREEFEENLRNIPAGELSILGSDMRDAILAKAEDLGMSREEVETKIQQAMLAKRAAQRSQSEYDKSGRWRLWAGQPWEKVMGGR